jgi:hypothetical protein
VVLSKAEAVGKVVGWEGNGSVLVMATTLSLKVEAAAVVVVMVVVVVVVERLEGVAVGADGKAVMEALKEGASPGKVVVRILDARVKGEDAVVVLLGAAAVGHSREEAAAGDSRTGVVVVVGWRMEGVAVAVAVWMVVVVEAGALRVGEVDARDSSLKTLEVWDRGESAARLSKSWMTSRKRTFR